MLNLKRKTRTADTLAPPAAATMSPWDKARHRHAEMRGKLAALQTRRAGLALAASLTRNPNDRERVNPALLAAAAPYEKIADDPDVLSKEIRTVDAELNRLVPEIQAAEEEFETARRRETSRRAIALQPEHKAAVERIDKAIAALLSAIAGERAVQARLSPLRSSAYLPPLGDEIAVNINFDGVAAWRARAKKLGIIK